MRYTKFFFVIIVAIFIQGCAHRNRLSKNPWMPDFKVHRDVLSNGLTVLYVEDHSVPVVSYATWFKVGSAWEKKGATGIAHLFEHLMFKGTPRYAGKEFFHKLESKGATVNAFTQRDATVYYEVVASPYLEQVIDMESDRLANLVLTQSNLDSELQIVKEERRLRIESNFRAQQLEELQKLAFPDHPYGWPVVGYQADLDQLTLEQCRNFFSTYYQPANAVVTIAGDFEYEKARQWMQSYYGKLKGRTVPKLSTKDPKIVQGEKRFEMNAPIETESILIGYYMPSMFDADAQKLAMLGWTVFGMGSSRGNLKLVREKKLLLGIAAEASSGIFPSLFLINAEVKSGVSASRAEEEIYSLIEEVKNQGIQEDELERVKNRIIYSTINEAKSPSGVASWLANGEFYWGNYQHVYKSLDQYHSMTVQDIKDVAKKYLKKENRVVVIMHK